MKDGIKNLGWLTSRGFAFLVVLQSLLF
ncbi:hypothetical protein LSO9J_80074 [Candidatus Liberibacter solanacearum]